MSPYLAALLEAIYPRSIRKFWPRYGRVLLRNVHITVEASEEEKQNGAFWPSNGLTMVGRRRLIQLKNDIESMTFIPGDIVECGVWRGGCLAWMRACANENNMIDRRVIGFDTFNGFVDAEFHVMDKPSTISGWISDFLFRLSCGRNDYLAVSKAEVAANIKALRLLTGITLVQGMVQHTLAKSDIQQVALARIDVDFYEPVLACLSFLWPRVSTGGCIHIDDYHVCDGCRNAAEHYATGRSDIVSEPIDEYAVKWTKL